MYQSFHGFLSLDKELRDYFPDYNYKGTIIEIGAFEPIRLSNTYHFEQNGWDAYHIEANSDNIKSFDIRKNKCLNYAVSNYNGDDVDFVIVTSSGWTAGYSALEPSLVGHTRFERKINKVNVRTLNYIFDNEWAHLKSRKIDIMTIDIEGGELNALKGLDMTMIRPELLVVEDHQFNDGTSDLHKYILSQNYKLDKFNGLDAFYKPI